MKEHDTIVIRPADKGSGMVVMDTQEYVNKLQGELTDNNTYVEVREDNTITINIKVKKIADEMCKNGTITKDLIWYIRSFNATSGRLQGNPKLHKAGLPLRTNVNGRGHPTEKMVEIIEEELRNNVTSLQSYIKDTIDFLNKLRNIKQLY